ncbi:hypothetical protein ACQR09_32490 [Bradyrhizobium oligotrophicum]|uniref:hypothetical protein n=1 Tax=Bradyrhizobium oligotrophicum TaxID=44255 RepID=UPI003EB8465A
MSESMPKEDQEKAYADRYCAYIDILGFSSLIGDIRKGKSPFEHVRDLLQIVHEPTTLPIPGVAPLDVRATSISDAIALSASFSAPGLAALIDMVSRLTLAVLDMGYFVRGGLCRGLLYHDQHMVFGEALINAYQMESTVARYPRVMVSKQAYDEAIASNLHNYFRSHLKQSQDGPYFVDVMEEVRITLKVLQSNPEEVGGMEAGELNRLENMRFNIESNLAEAADNPNHFEKAQWFARYWNEGLNEHREVGKVRGPVTCP